MQTRTHKVISKRNFCWCVLRKMVNQCFEPKVKVNDSKHHSAQFKTALHNRCSFTMVKKSSPGTDNSFVAYTTRFLLLVLSGLVMCLPLSAQESADVFTDVFGGDCGVKEITHKLGDFNYELWNDVSGKDACMYVKSNGDFYGKWDNISNALIRKSYKPGQSNQKIDFNVLDYWSEGTTFFGAYGWWANEDLSWGSTNHAQAVEYYVVEQYGTYEPKDDLVFRGVYPADGGDYRLYIGTISDRPSVYDGVKHFTQIKAIRVDGRYGDDVDSRRNSGTITMADHFNEWAKYEWGIGDLYEVSFKLEGYYDPVKNPSSTPSKIRAYVQANMSTSGSYTAGK